MAHSYSEDSLVEQPAIGLFQELGWEAANCYHETFGIEPNLSTLMQAPSPQPSPRGRGSQTEVCLGRETAAEVVLTSRLRPALRTLNPDLPPQAIESAIEQLTRERSAMTSVQANREIYKLLKNGIRVEVAGFATASGPSPQPSPRGRGSSL